MAEACEGVTPLHGSLPDEIVLWEIFVRLPPKPLLRCRAVCRNWHHVTSTRDFLLAHHARQRSLPLIGGYDGSGFDVVPFDHRPGVAATDQLQPVARLDDALFDLEASCDGLLILKDPNEQFSICNPVTRQYALLHQLEDFKILGMYPHKPTGEYRLLTEYDQDCFFVFTLGSTDPPRHISGPDAWEQMYVLLPVLFHGSLHMCTGHMITIFDTTAESFRQMRAPVVSGDVDLFESGGMLGMSIYNNVETTVDIWVMQDYEREVWTFKHRVEVPVAELTRQFGEFQEQWRVVVPSWDGDVFGLLKFGEWLLQIGIDGKLVDSFHRESLGLTPFWLKQTLVPHTFFATLEGYVVNSSPFI